jgi:hypothetical protein
MYCTITHSPSPWSSNRMHYLPWGYRKPTTPLNLHTMKRSKTSLPLTRFVAPKRLTTNINQVPKIETPTSSLTPVDDDSTMKGTDETADNEEVEAVVTVDRTKQMNTSGSTIEGDVDTAIPEVEEEGPDPSAILKSVETLHQDFIKHQTNFAEFVDKATSRIAKLENSISSNAQDEEEKKCKEGLQVLKNLMADTYKSSSTKVYVSALSFGDFDQQQSRTRSHLSRFTQLDSEDESAQSPTIDPSVLQPSRLMIEPAQSSGTSPDSSSQIQPSSQIKESEEEPPSSQQQVDAPEIVPVHQSPELNSDVEDLGPESPLPSPQFSPYRPSSSGAAASRPMSIDNSQNIRSSSPPSIPQATQATQSPEPTQTPLLTQPTQLLETTQSTQLTQPTPPPLPTPTHTNSQAQPLANKRLRRNQTLPARKKPPPQQPPMKKQKTQKSVTKSKPKKKPSIGQTGSLPVGTLKKSQGITRVKGADWPELGPNTVIGLGGYIECETARSSKQVVKG